MKKLLVVLLSLGLIVAISTAASAVDVKFSGSYYLVGVYDNNPNLVGGTNPVNDSSRAAWYQRARVQSVFVVADGLSMTVRFDALEKNWGDTSFRNATAADVDKTNSRKNYAPQNYIQENVEFERAYITFATPIGVWDVGYQAADQWGTVFGNSEATRPRIKLATKLGPLTLLAIYEKVFEVDHSIVSTATVPAGTATYAGKVDADADNYYLAGIYNFTGGEAGLLYKYIVDARQRPTASAYKTKVMGLSPYFKTTFGPVYLEGEACYAFGKAAEMDTPGVDIDMAGWNAYLLAKMNVGPAYFGGQVGWVQGDGDDAKKNTNGAEGGYDWVPTIILNNTSPNTWLLGGRDTGNVYKNDLKGYFLYNVFVGFNPTPKLNMEMNLSVVSYDKKKYWNAARTVQSELISEKLGTEVDVTATYKIYDTLSYMVGGAYLFAGDAWKGNIGSTAEVGNTYMLVNKLTLSF